MKYQYILCRATLLVVIACFGVSCTGNFDDINRNKDQVTRDELERENYNIGANLKGLQALVIPTQEHLHQFYEILAADAFCGYMESTADGWRSKFSTYNPPSDWLRAPFQDVLSNTYPFYRDIYNLTEDPVALALADVLRVAIMHKLTDTYGPIPYSKVIEQTDESLTVPYDNQQEVYMKMFDELDAAIDILRRNTDLGAEAFAKHDNLYAGNIPRWLRYANSLKLRMAVRLSYVNPAVARAKAEEAVGAGVITSNSDNALLSVEENRAAMIYNDWGDHRVGADIISYMQGYNDPRMDKMFTKGKEPQTGTEDYYGMRIGIDPRDKNTAASTYSKPLITGTDPFVWITAAEVAFLRAEGALRGWSMDGDAEELYNQAITLSFEEKGVSGAAAYYNDNTSMPARYVDPLNIHSASSAMSTVTVKWNGDPGQTEANLEKIITQKWIALFPNGHEAWAEYRRTGYPKLLPVVENKSGGAVNSAYGMRRLPYPAEEYSENNANVLQAVSILGGPDTGGTRIWWDVKPLN